jgi:hypothetical protein
MVQIKATFLYKNLFIWVLVALSLWDRWPGHEAYHSPPSSAKVKDDTSPIQLHGTHRNNFTFSFIHLRVHKFVTIRYTSVFIIHHPFTFMYNIFVKLVFTFHKKISYISVCKVPEYCDCHYALPQVHRTVQFMILNLLPPAGAPTNWPSSLSELR